MLEPDELPKSRTESGRGALLPRGGSRCEDERARRTDLVVASQFESNVGGLSPQVEHEAIARGNGSFELEPSHPGETAQSRPRFLGRLHDLLELNEARQNRVTFEVPSKP